MFNKKTPRGVMVRPPGGYGAADAIRNGDQVARADGYHGRAVAPYCPDDDGSTYGHHSKLTARIMAGASAQWYGTRTATVRVQYVGAFLEVATASGIDDE